MNDPLRIIFASKECVAISTRKSTQEVVKSDVLSGYLNTTRKKHFSPRVDLIEDRFRRFLPAKKTRRYSLFDRQRDFVRQITPRAKVVIKSQENGPNLVYVDTTVAAALWRCGHTAKKPFCDGSHRRIEFKAEAAEVKVLE